MKAVLLAGLMTLGSLSAYAATDFDSDRPMTEETQASQEAINEGLIPADQLDSVQYQTLAIDHDRDGDHDRDRHDRDRDRHDRDRHDRDRRGRDQRWTCVARNRIGRSFTGDDRDLGDARREAMRSCQRHTFIRGCRLVGCARR